MAAQSPIMILISDQLRDAADKYASDNNLSRAKLIRLALSKYIGYDLESEPKTNRQRKYSSPEERMAAQKARNKARRDATNKILEAVNRGDREEDIKALVRSLKNQLKK